MRHAVVLAFAVSLLAVGADARPPNGIATPEAEWFRSLKQPNGGSCCAETADGLPDCHRIDPSLVRIITDGDGISHYVFKAVPSIFGGLGDGNWHTIPDEVLIRGRKLAELGGNVTGLWVICAMPGGYMRDRSGILVLCAVPPSQT